MTAHQTKTLFQLCYPLFINAFLSLAVTLVDTMIISAYSDQAAAAVSIANQVLGLAYDFSALLGVGGVILIAQALGRNDEAEARRLAALVILANAGLSLMIALVMGLAGPLFVAWVNTPPEIVDDAVLYVRVIAVALTFNGFLMAAVGVLRAFGHVKTILVLGIFANVLYISLEYVLIHGWGPVPSLGVFGSALSTLIVRVTGVLLLVWVLARQLQLRYGVVRLLGDLRARVAKIFKLSYPSVLDNVAYGFYQLILVSLIAGLGVASVLGRSYTLALTAFLTLIVMTISQGNEVLVGYKVGAGHHEDARRRGLRSAAIAVGLSTLVAGVFYLLAGPLINLFTRDAAIHALARELLFLTLFLQPVSALNTILFHSLKASGDVYVPVAASLGIMWGVGLPLAYLACVTWGYGVVGLRYAFILEEGLKAAFMVYRWQGGRWRQARLVAQTPA